MMFVQWRRALVKLGALTAVACAGCGAPSIPTPAPGQPATLNPTGISYDRPGFRTDEKVRLDPQAVCTQLNALGKYSEDYGCQGKTSRNNSVTFKLEVFGFERFWNGNLSPFYYGISHSRREVLLGRYWAVELVNPAENGQCTLAVDLGAPAAMTVSVSTGSPFPDSLAWCDDARSTATSILRGLDPNGGSNVG